MFAYVRYLDSDEREIVPASSIKRFKPKSKTDFCGSKMYWVYLKPSAGGNANASEEGYYKAQVLLLEESEHALWKKVKSSRIRVPKLISRSDSDTSEDSNDEEGVTRSSQTQSAMRAQSLKKSWEGIMNEKREELASQVAPRPTKAKRRLYRICSEEESKEDSLPSQPSNNSANEGSPLQGESLRAAFEALKTKHRALIKRHKNLKTEVEELRTLNRALQKKGISDSGASDGREPALFSADSGGQVSGCNVHIGRGITVSAQTWTSLLSSTSDSKFIRNVCSAIWGDDVPHERSVKGMKCNTVQGGQAKPALTPQKLATARGAYHEYVWVANERHSLQAAAMRDSAFNRIVSDKIQYLCKKAGCGQ